MSEIQKSQNSTDTPQVMGELLPTDQQDLQESAAWSRQTRSHLVARLGDAAVPGMPTVDQVHVYGDRDGQHFVVSSGENAGDRVSARGAARLGLGTPSEELEKLQARKDMDREEWNYFSGMADMLAGSVANGAPSETIDAQASDMLMKFNNAADKRYYSPATKIAFNLLYLGARRTLEDGSGTLGDVIADGYLNEADAHQLEQTVQEIERFKKMSGYSQETIEQQLVQSTAANVAHRPEGTYSAELTFALNAYALGVTSRVPAESTYYRQQLEGQVTS